MHQEKRTFKSIKNSCLMCRKFLAALLIGCLTFPSLVQAATANILSAKIISRPLDEPTVEIHYDYDGSFGPVFLGIMAKTLDGSIKSNGFYALTARSGNDITATAPLVRPSRPSKISTDLLEVILYQPGKDPFLTKVFKQHVDWPEQPMASQGLKQDKHAYYQKLLNDAVEFIDNIDHYGSDDLNVAKRNLDKIILEDPNFVQAYLELARIAMKGDSNPSEDRRYSGLDEAQRLIQVALKVNPNYANSYILYGYVLGVKKQPDAAITAFKKAQQIGTKNMWLYYNWGLTLQNVNRTDEAIKKYGEGIALTPLPDTPELHSSNRAIPAIFYRLNELLEQREDWASIDSLYQKRLTVLHEPCENAYYAGFKLYKLGQYNEALQKATQAFESDCAMRARPVLAAAYFTKWALDPSMAKIERDNTLNKAQALISDTPQLIMNLASSPATAKTLPKLKSAGIQLDGLDAKGMTPLAYAVANADKNTVRRLIGAGANVNKELKDGWSVLMLAAATGKTDVVKVLLDSKADPEKRTRDGQSAISVARATGNNEILKILQTKVQY